MGEAAARTGYGGMRRAALLPVIACAVASALAGCSDSLPSMPKIGDLNPFAEKQKPLPGTRIPVIQAAEKIPGELASADKRRRRPTTAGRSRAARRTMRRVTWRWPAPYARPGARTPAPVPRRPAN
jgi:hypothetical protein